MDQDIIELLLRNAPSNFKHVGPKYGQDLVDVLSSVSVYVQASEWESFCCAVVEAMFCECIPVVANKAALPEIVGDVGLYLDEISSVELTKKIQLAFIRPKLGKVARARVLEKFPLSKRRDKLLKVIVSI